MSAGIQLVLTTALVAVPPGCSWAHPGANPYRGEPARALADFDLPDQTRRQLRRMLAERRYTDVAVITRDDIVGAHGYADLREMHSGHGRVCHGAVDRSAWRATRRERGLVYCVGEACVIVPTICNNISLVTRQPEREAVLDDGPIDIAPAAGPSPTPADTPTTTPADAAPPIAFLPVPDSGGGAPDRPDAGGFPGGGLPVGGGPPCCDTGPVGPGSPGTPPVTTPVPEAPTGTLLLAGLALLAAWRRQRR